MKRILKIFLILLIAVVAFGIGFVLTLQIFEYRPKAETELEVTDNLSKIDANYVELNTSIKIVTFNTGYASLSRTEDFVMDGGSKARMDTSDEVEANVAGITKTLEDQNADIYLLQEVDVDSHRSYEINQYSEYISSLSTASVLGYNYRCIFVPFPLSFTEMMGKVNSGIVTFSSFYIDDAKRIQLPGSFPWPVRLAQLKRCLVITRLPIKDSDKELILINVHLSAYDDGSMRLQEMDALKAIMKEEYSLGNYVVVGGDFNQTFPQAVYTNYDSVTGKYNYVYTYELKDENFYQAFPMEEDWFIENGFQFGVDISTPTNRLLNKPYDSENPDNNQYYLIDGYIVSNNVKINSVKTLDEGFMYSDHNPVFIDISLNK